MVEKFISKDDLQQFSKEELIEKYWTLQRTYRLLKNEKQRAPTNLQLMLDKFQPKKRNKVKTKKKIDFENCNYRHIALKVAYLGWNYDGLQENDDLDDTIEKILKTALRQVRLVGDDIPVKFTRCGRTDKGVSAFSQVMSVLVRTRLTEGPSVSKWRDITLSKNEKANESRKDEKVSNGNEKAPNIPANHRSIEIQEEITSNCTKNNVETDPDIPDFDFVLMLNQVLPPEIRVLGWTPVDQTFSARWECKHRVYNYYFPLGKLDIDKMNQAGSLLCGLHDFRNFCKLNLSSCKTFVRRIYEFSVKLVSGDGNYTICCATISASGFLYHQVRQMMTVLFLVGMGKENPELVSGLLDIEKCPGRPAYDLSPSYPLVLFDAQFENLVFKLDRLTAVRLLAHFQNYWSELAIKTVMVKKLVDTLENETETTLSGEVGGFMGVNDQESSTIKGLNSSVGEQCSAHGVNYTFLKQPCSLQHKVYKNVLERTKCKTVEEHLATLYRKRLHSPSEETQPCKIIKGD